MSAAGLDVRSLPPDLEDAWREARERWRGLDGSARLYRRDASLFTGGDEDRWLGWLDLPSRPLDDQLAAVAAQVREEGIERVVLLGMGGSSLGAEALVAHLGGDDPAADRFTVLDTTEPVTVSAALERTASEQTLVVAASKSGGTLETELLLRVFAERVPPDRLAVITDPGSKLEAWARERGARFVLLGDPAVGGRFSVLSPFGLTAPAALGLSLDRLLAGARRAETACREGGDDDPAAALGTLMAAAAIRGRPLLTVAAGSPGAGAFGDWLEQLVAESLGKAGAGLLPVVGEDLAGSAGGLAQPGARLVLAVEPGAPATTELEAAGVPVVSLTIDPVAVDGGESLGFELYRCEAATAVAGALIGVHPFDQPDVEAAKSATRAWIARAESGEPLSAGRRVGAHTGIQAFAPADQEPSAPGGDEVAAAAAPAVGEALDALFAAAPDARVCALLAFLHADPPTRAALEDVRRAVGRRWGVATSVGLGPRYLHSTGQFHKGGSDIGVYLVLARAVASVPAAAKVPIPDGSSFAEVHLAQALGDFEALAAKGRRVLLLEIGGDPADTLARLTREIE